MMLAVVLVISWQCWTMLDRPRSSFLLSYWFVSWDHGFVRRGLLGEINQLLFGPDLIWGAALLSWVAAGVSAAAMAGVALALIWRGTTPAVGLGWLLVVSPFTIKGMLNFARPDQLAVPLLLAAGAVLLLRPRRPEVPLAVLGLLFGTAMLGHEGIVLTVAPWILLLIVHFSPGLGFWAMAGRTAAFLAAPVLVALVVLTRGTASPAQVALLERDVEQYVPRGNTMAHHLDDSTIDGVRTVVSYGLPDLVAMVLVAIVLWSLHALACWCVPGFVRWPPRRTMIALAGLVIPATALQFAMAIDWQRWFALYPAMGLLTYAVALLVDRPRTGPSTTGPSWTRRRIALFVVVALMLTVVPISTANNKLPCSVDYLVREAPAPFQRIGEAVTGEEQEHPRRKC